MRSLWRVRTSFSSLHYLSTKPSHLHLRVLSPSMRMLHRAPQPVQAMTLLPKPQETRADAFLLCGTRGLHCVRKRRGLCWLSALSAEAARARWHTRGAQEGVLLSPEVARLPHPFCCGRASYERLGLRARSAAAPRLAKWPAKLPKSWIFGCW